MVGKGESRTSLKVHKAYKLDVKRLVVMIHEGKLTPVEAGVVGFVSRAVYNSINKKVGDSVWLSNGVDEITLGADPEFGLIASGQMTPYGDVRLMRGDRVLKKAGKFGSDGPGVEIRPDPSIDHTLVVKNIRNILRNAPAEVGPYNWLGGATFTDRSRTYWFGGHIHLGRPVTIDADFADCCYSGIATVLDHLLAFPLLRFDTPNPEKRRNGCGHGYGKAGTGDTENSNASIRTNYPNRDRFEYRVLSGLWLTHPILSQMVAGGS